VITRLAPTFVLTGVTGKLGSRILKKLLENVKPSDIAISARDPSRLASLSDNGHRVLQGSFDDPDSLAASFKGAKKLLLVSSSDTSGKGQEHHRNAIKAAQVAGIQMIYYTSHQGASHTSLFWPCRDHAATEDMLEQSGIPYVSLRNGFYMDVLGQFTQSVQYTNAFSAPLDGPVSWTHHDDLAKGAASLMIRSEPVPKIVTLINPKAMDLDEVAKVYTKIKGSEVRRLVVGEEEYVEQLKGHGVPEQMAQGLLGIFAAAKEGTLQSNDGALGDILSGKFTDVEQYLKHSQ